MLHKLQLGDFSGDGHGIVENFYVDIPDHFTEEQIKTNYENNQRKLGFGYGDIANEYEEPTISAAQIKELEKAGLTFVETNNVTKDNAFYLSTEEPDYKKVIVLQKPSQTDSNVNKFYFYKVSYIRIVMFMIGDGLKDFVWKPINIEARPLVGSRSFLSYEYAGYGFYGF